MALVISKKIMFLTLFILCWYLLAGTAGRRLYQGKYYVEGLCYQEAIEGLPAFHLFEIGKSGSQPDTYKCQVKPEGAE